MENEYDTYKPQKLSQLSMVNCFPLSRICVSKSIGKQFFLMNFHGIFSALTMFLIVTGNVFFRSGVFSKVMAYRRKTISQLRKLSAKPTLNEHLPTVASARLTIQAETQKVEDGLKLLIARMKSFVGEFEFDAKGFEGFAESFQKTLDQFHFLTDDSTGAGLDLKEQYMFTKRMLNVMLYSANLLSLYQKDDDYSLRLLCKILDLNVRMLAIFNLYGDPDLKAKGFGDRVLSFKLSLYYWGASFDYLRKVPLDTRLIFQQQFEQAETSIECLTTFIPKMDFEN